MKKTAVIFDMDGVVSDTQKFHAEVESLILQDFNINMPAEAITKQYSGVPDDVMFKEIFNEHNIVVGTSIDDIVMQKWDKMAIVAKNRITAIPYSIDLIKLLKKNGFKLAIASASTNVFINEVLIELDLIDYFDAIVSSQEVELGKPAPDVFLLAAKKLGVRPEKSIVIEDGRSGMIGATAAGMPCIGLVDNLSDIYPASLTVLYLKDITVDIIHAL